MLYTVSCFALKTGYDPLNNAQKVATTLYGKEPTKINTAAIGNICRQLHVHVLARYEGDKAWPGPVRDVPTLCLYSEIKHATRGPNKSFTI